MTEVASVITTSEYDPISVLREMLHLERCHFRPFAHQVEGINAIVNKPVFMLADEMGAGKTLQAIVASCLLFEQGKIDKVIIIAPAAVRSVWYDPELGELAKHLFVPAVIEEFHARRKYWFHQSDPDSNERRLEIYISNYEYLRRANRFVEFTKAGLHGPRTFLILDESSAIKDDRTDQTKAIIKLRRMCGRVLLLNGTPIANSPMDMYAQGVVMDPGILGCQNRYHYRARYAIMGGFQQKQIVGWHDLDHLQKRFAPYILRRLKEDCLDLPPKLPPVTLEVALSAETWKIYKEMRDEMIAWLNESTTVVTQQAIVKVLRLAQITSGFIGGLVQESSDDEDATDLPPNYTVAELSREKMTLLMSFLTDLLVQDPNIKVIVWCRFRYELKRMLDIVQESLPVFQREAIYGGQPHEQRLSALRALDPRTAPAGPVFVGGTYGTGAKGLNLTAAHTVINVSYDYSLEKFLQSADRVHRPGQEYPVSYFDIIATGPQKQKTIDHHIVKTRRLKENIADFTTAAWVRALVEE